MRKIRVIYSDPDATDYSSDDEQSVNYRRSANGKRFVHEISISTPSNHQDSLSKLISDSSSREDGPINQEINSTIVENHKIRVKQPGIQMTESGKWDVQAYNPMEGTLTGLGSYSTIEEATKVYNNKNLEFSLLDQLIKQQTDQLSGNKRQRFVLDGLTIFETETHKWATWTTDPISNVKIWVGAYAYPEEAIESYCKKKFAIKIGSSHTDISSFNRPGLKLTKTGKWGVTIQHPALKSKYCMGSFDTTEEVAKVYDKNKADLDANHNNSFFKRGASADGLSVYVINSQGERVQYNGVRLRKSGRWCAEIEDPIKEKNIYLGTFDTPEEAIDAYNKTKRELDEITSNANKKAKSNDDISVDVMIKTEPNNGCLSSSTVTAVSSQNSEGNYNHSNNNEKQIPCFSVVAKDESGCGVIDCYGQLRGEYSKIDDELWFKRLEDFDESDANGAIGAT